MLFEAGRLQLEDVEGDGWNGPITANSRGVQGRVTGPLQAGYSELLQKYRGVQHRGTSAGMARGQHQLDLQPQELSNDELKRLRALASPRLLTVQFNSW